MPEGKIKVTQKNKLIVTYVNPKNKTVDGQVSDSELAEDLFAIARNKQTIRQLDGVEVEFELVEGRLTHIRRKGQDWQQPSAGPREAHQASGSSEGEAYESRPGQPDPSQRSRSDPQSRQQSAGGSRSNLPGEFHNPYNFIPALPRDNVSGDLGDRFPPGHERYHADRWSGRISVKLTVVTPLVIPDAAAATPYSENQNTGHKSFPIRLGPDGKPYLAPTSVKGMLRAAYEAVTNSRLAVFVGWERRLAFRQPAKVTVEPARVEHADDQVIKVRILKQRWQNAPAKLPRYLQRSQRDPRKGEDHAALRYPDKTLPQHGDHVIVKVASNGRVTEIKPYSPSVPQGWFEGWVLITGPNIKNKKAERVFVISPNDEILTYQGSEVAAIRQLWSDLIRDYQLTHEKDLKDRENRHQNPGDYLGDEPGRTGWSRHIYDSRAVHLSAGTLCYVRRDQGKITGLYPVAISRDLYPCSPLDLVSHTLCPPKRYENLSPADRVFGWVNQEGEGAYRGNLRIGPVVCQTDADKAIERFGSPGVPLAILGQPKPQQARFYVAASPKGEAQQDGQPKEKAGYQRGKGLRGRKVYPHHRYLAQSNLSTEYWTYNHTTEEQPAEDPTQQPLSSNGKTYFREYLRPCPTDPSKSQRDDQNRSIQGWVKPGTQFTFDIYGTNLSQVELGALLWLLSLNESPKGQEGQEAPQFFYRLGGGKPLGFGSVRLEITDMDVRPGESWQTYYESLEESPPPQYDKAGCVLAFKQAVVDAYATANPQSDLETRFSQVPFIAAFLRACEGFADNLPIHYPRARQPGQKGPVPPHPEGKAYEWFVANDRTGTPRGGPFCLPNLTEDKGLPILAVPQTHR